MVTEKGLSTTTGTNHWYQPQRVLFQMNYTKILNFVKFSFMGKRSDLPIRFNFDPYQYNITFTGNSNKMLIKFLENRIIET
jgi:hypothetical protein